MVWSALRAIPEGDILTYSQLAGRVGRPSAVRAVASACGRNRIGVLIPCHRVLRGNGELGGYRWGLDRKQALLQTERNRVAGSRVSATAV
jgi:AraC family transcriptional regulator of adaptative response/methylated-DNA-[protein]-cysteine methyltransferase